MVERDICCVDKFLTSLENNLLAKQQSGGSGEREKAMVKLIMEKDESKKRKGTAKKTSIMRIKISIIDSLGPSSNLYGIYHITLFLLFVSCI